MLVGNCNAVKQLYMASMRVLVRPRATFRELFVADYPFVNVVVLSVSLAFFSLVLAFISLLDTSRGVLLSDATFSVGFVLGFVASVFFKAYLLYAIMKKAGLEVSYKTTVVLVAVSMAAFLVFQCVYLVLIPGYLIAVPVVHAMFHAGNFVLMCIGVWELSKFDVFRVVFINLLVLVCVNYILYALWIPDSEQYPSYLLPLFFQ